MYSVSLIAFQYQAFARGESSQRDITVFLRRGAGPPWPIVTRKTHAERVRGEKTKKSAVAWGGRTAAEGGTTSQTDREPDRGGRDIRPHHVSLEPHVSPVIPSHRLWPSISSSALPADCGRTGREQEHSHWRVANKTAGKRPLSTRTGIGTGPGPARRRFGGQPLPNLRLNLIT